MMVDIVADMASAAQVVTSRISGIRLIDPHPAQESHPYRFESPRKDWGNTL
ncbi:MAG: hypothetical protein U9Q79_03670 [Candidatus Hydrogenedentes bacterium]|nr:hypothetical protein [Candidatus Hydrogenedentota bacterium]